MSFGIKSYGDDGYLNLHSDYSSLVYIGEASINVDPIRAVYTGEGAETISSSRLTSNYDLGYIVQFRIQGSYSHIVPFYIPRINDQEIAILDMYDGGTYWDVNVLFSGTSTQTPKIHVFAPLTEISNPEQSDYGITVYDGSGDIVFTDRYRPLRVDDVVTITHPSSIKTNSRGSCGNDAGCDINYTPNQQNLFSGSVTNTETKMYHVVTSAYGGLAYTNSGTYSRSCGFLGLGTRKYAWGYQSWASFRGTIKHTRDTVYHKPTYAGDFCGKIHQLKSSSCGFSGFLGALLALGGVLLAPFTAGASLGVTAAVGVTAAIVGFAVGEALSPSTPSLRAYETDEVFDTANTQNLIMTDADYYGIDTSWLSGGGSGGTFTGTYEYSGFVNPWYWWATTPTDIVIYWNDTAVYSQSHSDPGSITSVTGTDGYTYYRGAEYGDVIDAAAFGGSGIFYYYPVGRA